MIVLRKLFIPFVLSLLVLVSFSCIDYKPVELKEVKNVSIKSIEDSEIEIELELVIANPNNKKFSVRDANLTVSLGEIPLGSLNEIKAFSIEPNSTKSYIIPLTVDLENMKSNAKQLTKSIFKQGASLHLQGYIKARAFPITKKIEINENAKLDLFKSIFG